MATRARTLIVSAQFFALAIQLIAIDLDGTLLTAERKIHPHNVAAVQEAANAGIQIVLASGRIRTSMDPFAEILGLTSGPRVCCNGAHVIAPNGDTLAEFGLPDEERDRIIDFAIEYDLHLNAYTSDKLYFTADDAWGEYYQKAVKTIQPNYVSYDQLREMSVLKLMFVGEADVLKQANKEIVGKLDSSKVRITESEPEYLEFLSPSADKGQALAHLCRELGVAQGETAAIGDYFNDLEMIRWVGIGGAIGNADPEVKSAASVIAPTNDEGGVAWFIRKVLEG